MQLKLKSQTVQIVDYNDLCNFIEEAYGIDKFEYVALEELNNYSYKNYSIRKGEFDDYDLRKLEKFKQNPTSVNYITGILLTDLCNKGWLEEGDYMVHVSW